MSATVGKLLQCMKTISPPEQYFEFQEDDKAPKLPFDPKLKQRALEACRNNDITNYFAVLEEAFPDKGHNVFENIFIGGKNAVEVCSTYSGVFIYLLLKIYLHISRTLNG